MKIRKISVIFAELPIFCNETRSMMNGNYKKQHTIASPLYLQTFPYRDGYFSPPR